MVPAEQRLEHAGHAGAIVEAGRGSYESKCQTLRNAGVTVLDLPSDLDARLWERFEGRDGGRPALR